jgi:hypothetical protein
VTEAEGARGGLDDQAPAGALVAGEGVEGQGLVALVDERDRLVEARHLDDRQNAAA